MRMNHSGVLFDALKIGDEVAALADVVLLVPSLSLGNLRLRERPEHPHRTHAAVPSKLAFKSCRVTPWASGCAR